MKLRSVLLPTCLALVSVACTAPRPVSSAEEVPAEEPSGLAAVSEASFATLVDAFRSTELAEALANDGPFTVFAPTDEAFSRLPYETRRKLFQDPEVLKDVLSRHVVRGQILSEDVAAMDSAETLRGDELAVRQAEDALYVDDARVTSTDVLATNGVIHVIDAVLLPEDFAVADAESGADESTAPAP